ncbi:uncharacterized protein LOC125661273 isoform X1 [Ostrea edulis]|uniref:uncharacterized protein LOC125661273 isoform X1 n=2 Tax=Ostrea edulis TaxID=37623 RepID=UPI0024AF6C77|nr:uncharacterized protein LOC125661273 isoform X1 [Ostrea edulis]
MEKNNSQKRRRRGPYKRTTYDLFENESLMVFNSSEAGSLHETHVMENTMHSSTDFLQCETGASQITKKQGFRDKHLVKTEQSADQPKAIEENLMTAHALEIQISESEEQEDNFELSAGDFCEEFEECAEFFDNSDAELEFDESFSEKETTDIQESEDNQPLYPNASITLGTFMLLFTSFCMKHNISSDGILQLLNIFSYVLPSGHSLCTSLYDYKKFFVNLKNPLIKHFYCPYCLGYLHSCTEQECPYDFCGKLISENEIMYFLEMPVDSQLRNLFSQQGFYEKLNHRFQRENIQEKYGDVYDGELYRSYSENGGPLSQQENVSFTFNTDGAPVFKSSKISVWPIFLVVNELPYKLRMLKENMLMAGLWFGPCKPAMGTFLSPFLDCFKRLHDGIQCFSPFLGNFTCRAYLLNGTADLPARSLLCNSVQYNGSFSCWKCLQKGETSERGKGHTHIFPYITANPKGPERTVNDVHRDAQQAMNNLEHRSTGYSVNGVKGPSWLTFFPKYNIVSGISIDYMHGVLLGVQKLMLRLWFSSEFKSKNFSFHKHVQTVDFRLKNLKPTLDISRLPRSIENDLKYWKAYEYRSFLLYFGAPLLFGILDKNRFNHYLQLVNGIHILLKYGSTKDEVSDAETMLLNFCANFECLYDKCFMTLNIHQLVHLADSVRILGPLYTHSCFSFEDKNGFLLKMIQGTQNIDSQIVTGVSFVQKIPELKQKFLESTVKGSELEKLLNAIESPNLLIRGEMVERGVYILGGVKLRDLLEDEYMKLCDFLGYAPVHEKFRTFKRIEFLSYIIYGLHYKRMTKRDNSTIMYMDGNDVCFGRVRFFLIFTRYDQRTTVLALTEKLASFHYSKNCNVLKVKKTNEFCFIPIEKIKEGCMFLEVQNDNANTCYVCRFPNKLEGD